MCERYCSCRWLTGCYLCSSVTEPINHLFCECPVATNLWNGFDDHVGGSFVEIVENYLKRNDAHKTLEMAARLWATWSARNEALWNNKIWSANYLKGFVESCVSSWQQNYFPNTRPLHEVHNAAPVMWSPPPMGMLKCNVDASLHQNGLGFGAVIRDHAGQFVAANIGRLRIFILFTFANEKTNGMALCGWAHHFMDMRVESRGVNRLDIPLSSNRNFDNVKLSCSVANNSVFVMSHSMWHVLGVRQASDFGRVLGLPVWDATNRTYFGYVESKSYDRHQYWGYNGVSFYSSGSVCRSVLRSQCPEYIQSRRAGHWALTVVSRWQICKTGTGEVSSVDVHTLSVNFPLGCHCMRSIMLLSNVVPSTMGMLKCNIDASLHQNGLGFGAVIRDHAGQFVAANIGRLRPVASNKDTPTETGICSTLQVADFASNPIIRVSMGTNMPPPPTPPTLPNAAPKNPIMLPRTIFQSNFISYSRNIAGRNAQRLKLSQVEIIVGNIKAGEIMKIRENPQILKPVERNINLLNSGR
nr:uncharacterized protein LOC109150345 [Ipomoea batatas]